MTRRTFLASLTAPIVAAQAQQTTTVRGRLDRRGRDGRTYPAPNITVTLNHPQHGRSRPANSGNDGMYYLMNVPGGRYTLEVWVAREPWQFVIDVDRWPYYNVRPIVVP